MTKIPLGIPKYFQLCGTRYRNAHEALGSLFQEEGVEDYIENFEELSALIADQSEEQSIGWFLRGLKTEIRNWVRTLNPSSCDQAMELARNVESAMGGRIEKPSYRPRTGNTQTFSSPHSFKSESPNKNTQLTPPKPTYASNSSNPNRTRPPDKPQFGNSNRTPNVRHLTSSEWEERRKKGLCFRCGQRYSPQHKCADGGLRVLLLADGETLGADGEVYSAEILSDEEEEENAEGTCNSLELSSGPTNPSCSLSTIKLVGEINGVPVLILVDSGATHNFLSKRLAIALGLHTSPIKRTCIKMGDDRRVWMTEGCTGIPIKLGSYSLNADALVYDLGSLDLILGIAWLKTLGDGISSTQECLSSILSCVEDPHEHRNIPSPELQLSREEQEQLDQLLKRFPNLFRAPKGLPPARPIEHKSSLKRDRGLYYRALNKVTVLDKYPIPVVEELLDELHNSRFFSKIDLKSGFYQVRVREEDVGKTTFRTHNGHYEFLVMPFGLTNAPATFQALMNDVFRQHLKKGVLVFFDDILVYSNSWVDHLALLSEIHHVHQKHRLVVNRKKSTFGQRSVEYLGHIIDGSGVSMDPTKISSVTTWPTPTTVKAVRGFLGLTGYYRKFIRDYGKIAKPLTELTKKDGFRWGPPAQDAFEKLKQAMVTAPVLALPDFSTPFLIECGASGLGLGVVLMQSKRPIAFFSKALTDKNLNRSAYDKELMALVLAIQHWRPYLLGRHFIVSTDQKSLKFLLEQRITTPDQQNWVAKLLGYQFTIVYKPGCENRAADSLSRITEGSLQAILSAPSWLDGDQLLAGADRDPYIQKISNSLLTDPSSKPGFALVAGKLHYKGRLVVPPSSPWIPKLIEEFHNSPTGGHSGYYRTYRRLASRLYWPGMTKTIQLFVRSCDICQRFKSSTLSPNGLLQPLPIPQQIWEDISLDFITGLPKYHGYEVVLVVVDRLSKYCHFVPLKHPYTARSLAEVFLKEIIRLHGIPKTVLSDRDPLFLSTFWKEIFSLQGSKLHFSSAYHPETDGQTEVVNRSLETYLRCFAAEQPKTWSFWLPWAEYWHNTSFHISTNTTPFETVYGRPPPSILQFAPGEIQCEAVAREFVDRDEALKQLKYHLARSQERMKKSAYLHRRDENFDIGDWVFLKLCPHRQQSVVHRINQKLAARYYGPFQITAKMGPVAYKLKLPVEAKVHPVFHASLLKRAMGNFQAEPTLPKELEMDPSDQPSPKYCLAVREVLDAGKKSVQWLIQWDSGTTENATWEDAFHIQSQFPDFKLEDKLDSQDRGIDRDRIDESSPTNEPTTDEPNRPRVWKVYRRRKSRGQVAGVGWNGREHAEG
ncbi:hypothetical protein LXL04_014281 [Taraxacum kok-saghyz]